MSAAPRRRWLALALQAGLAVAVWPQMAAAVAPSPASADADAAPPEVRGAFNGAMLQGAGQLRFLGLRVYDARLWAPAGQPVPAGNWAQPLALEIRYQRALQGQQIAERSLQEMKRQGELDEATARRWLQAMQGLFPDVVPGNRITAVHLPREGARFYVNGQLKGAVSEAEFARRFLGIWLSPQTSDPKLRTALLGLGAVQATP